MYSSLRSHLDVTRTARPCIVLFSIVSKPSISSFFFFNDTATTEIYTLSLHDALPICPGSRQCRPRLLRAGWPACHQRDRKSTRLNSSHTVISYAVFCLKKKNTDRHKVHQLCGWTHDTQSSGLIATV